MESGFRAAKAYELIWNLGAGPQNHMNSCGTWAQALTQNFFPSTCLSENLAISGKIEFGKNGIPEIQNSRKSRKSENPENRDIQKIRQPGHPEKSPNHGHVIAVRISIFNLIVRGVLR